MKKTKTAVVLTVIMMMAAVAVPAVSANTSKSVHLTATALGPRPDIAIELSATELDFGPLYNGETSTPQDLKVTNIGLKAIDVTATASDKDGQEPLFVLGLLIDGGSYADYSTTLAVNGSDDTQLSLHMPDDYASKGVVCGCATFWAEEHSAGQISAADFSADVTSGIAPLTVQLTDLSTNSPTNWTWDFGDGSNSTEQNPSHTYTAKGSYTIMLSACNSTGCEEAVKTAYITVTDHPSEETTWSLFHGDQQLTGYYAGDAPDTNAVKWTSSALDAVGSSSFAIGEGKLFVYCLDTSGKSYIAGLDVETGTTVWKKECAISNTYGSWATPAYHDGLVFTPGDGARYASNGTLAWSGLPDNTNGSPMVADGKVVIGNWDGGKYIAYNEKTGAQAWQFTVTGNAQGTPAYHDGKLFLTSCVYGGDPGGYLYCVNAETGSKVWSVNSEDEGEFCGSPCVYGGNVYVTSYNWNGDGALFCYKESNGSLAWSKTVQRTDSTPAVYNGRVYITGGAYGYSDHITYCFDAATGAEVWSTTADQDIGGWTSSVVIADGKVFVGREGEGSAGQMEFGYVKLFALNAGTGTVVWETNNGGATVAIYDGVVFTAGIDGKVYAFGT